jgi:Txe/YoeB family toxin of Txe-Axe toxin-antitoxin module
MEEKLKKCQENNSNLAESLEQLLQKATQDHFSG